jgi:hypothetical protein
METVGNRLGTAQSKLAAIIPTTGPISTCSSCRLFGDRHGVHRRSSERDRSWRTPVGLRFADEFYQLLDQGGIADDIHLWMANS